MNFRHYSVVCAIVIICILSGCAGLTGDSNQTQESPIELIGNNTANNSFTLEVFLVEPSTKVHVKRDDGLNRTASIPEGSLVDSPGEGLYFTSVEPEPAQLVVNVTVSSGEVVERTIANRPLDTKVMIVPYDSRGHIPEWHVEDCANYGFYSISVQMTSDGVFVDVLCN